MDVAIRVQEACKSYKSGDTVTKVLDHLKMTVHRGHIYGLLGASGCGKTTLLSCIVGRRDLDSGEITILGGKPGQSTSIARIGHMPQDVALVGEFTVRDAVNYFGWIYGMPNEDIDERFEFLSSLLELPPRNCLVKELSGGQQRRVSLAAALVHQPQLLILDEPTVGLDPVLRSRIWNYFLELTTEKRITIVITTHYIEEATQAHIIGLMRNGRLLAEKSPRELLSQYNKTHLEDVFHVLSRQQEELEQEIPTKTTPAIESNGENSMNGCLSSIMDESLHDTRSLASVPANHDETELLMPLYKSSTKGRMKALLMKNTYRIVRDLSGLIFTLGFPILQLLSFRYGIGGEPWGLNIAVVNDELGHLRNCDNFHTEIIYNNSDFSCSAKGLSCLYLSYVDNITTPKVFYENKEDATNAVLQGEAMGVLYFHQNFSEELRVRFENGRFASNETIFNSEIQVHLDMSDQVLSLKVKQTLAEAYIKFAEKVLNDCDINPKAVKLPMQINDPVYGDGKQTYIMFMVPALIMSFTFFLALMLTAIIIISERHDGVWDRSIVSGVSFTEILASLIIVHAVCMLFQIAILLLMTFYFIGATCQGDIYTVIALVVLQGFSGMCLGFITSTVCDNFNTAFYLSLGSFFPYIFLSGLMWPLEGMPRVLYFISLCLPGTIPIISLRNVFDRGWSIQEPSVYNGFLITSFWIVLECGLCIYTLRKKHK